MRYVLYRRMTLFAYASNNSEIDGEASVRVGIAVAVAARARVLGRRRGLREWSDPSSAGLVVGLQLVLELRDLRCLLPFVETLALRAARACPTRLLRHRP